MKACGRETDKNIGLRMEKKRLQVLRDSGGRTGGKCTAKGG